MKVLCTLEMKLKTYLMRATLSVLCFHVSVCQLQGKERSVELHTTNLVGEFCNRTSTFCLDVRAKAVGGDEKGHGKKTFYFDISDNLDILWKDGDMHNNHTVNYSNILRDKTSCSFVIWGEANEQFKKPSAGLACEEKPRNDESTLAPSQHFPRMDDVEVNSTIDYITETPISKEVGFSLHLPSFLIGFFIPTPFLIVAVAKTIFTQWFRNAKNESKGTGRSTKQDCRQREGEYATEENARAIYINMGERSMTENSAYERPVGARWPIRLDPFNSATGGYETPISSHIQELLRTRFTSTSMKTAIVLLDTARIDSLSPLDIYIQILFISIGSLEIK